MSITAGDLPKLVQSKKSENLLCGVGDTGNRSENEDSAIRSWYEGGKEGIVCGIKGEKR